MKFDLSIVTAAFNEEQNIQILVNRINALSTKDFLDRRIELIIVDDGSTDSTWIEIQKAVRLGQNPGLCMTGVQLLNNYGQMEALRAGLKVAEGEYVLTIDSDLQHPIDRIIDFWNSREPFSIIAGVQELRQDAQLKSVLSRSFYWLLTKITKGKVIANAGDFRLYPREILDHLLLVGGGSTVLRFTAARIGIPIKPLNFKSEMRLNGHTSYSFMKMLRLAINSLISSSMSPLKMVLGVSVCFFFISLTSLLYALIVYLSSKTVQGWTSLFILISLGFTGIFTSLYLISEYLGKTFENSQNYPGYIVRNFEKSNQH